MRGSWLYFAYGSNMPRRRIEARVGECSVLTIGVLPRYELRFHKRGRDGSGKCDAYWTGNHAHGVYGVVYRIHHGQRETLDRIEGSGYENREVAVHAATGIFDAYTYVARSDAIERTVLPFTWYKALVTEGAREHRLPEDYIARLASTPARADPDRVRSDLHFALARRVGPSGAAADEVNGD